MKFLQQLLFQDCFYFLIRKDLKKKRFKGMDIAEHKLYTAVLILYLMLENLNDLIIITIYFDS